MAGDVRQVPLFPLHVVLVPGMALPLHIFEERYRRMTSDCLDSEQQIGVVLALPQSEHGRELPARVGTLARIADYERLPDGRYNLLAVGTRRFEVLEFFSEHPYLTARVRLLPEEGAHESALGALSTTARNALHEYLELVFSMTGDAEPEIRVPSDPVDLSYVVVMCLSCDETEKQRLLEISRVADRLDECVRLLREETHVLIEQATIDDQPVQHGDHNGMN